MKPNISYPFSGIDGKSIHYIEWDRIYQYRTKNASREFAQSLDLSNLEYGWYKMEVNTNSVKYEKRLIVNRSGIQWWF